LSWQEQGADEDCEWSTGEIIGMGKPKYSEENLPQCTLCPSQISWTKLGFNPGLSSERPATNSPKDENELELH
jgi:hypothetical protein